MNICTLNKLYKGKCYFNILSFRKRKNVGNMSVDKNIIILIEIKVPFSLSQLD